MIIKLFNVGFKLLSMSIYLKPPIILIYYSKVTQFCQ